MQFLTLHRVEIQITVVVEVKEAATAGHDLHIVVAPRATVVVHKVEACFGGAVHQVHSCSLLNILSMGRATAREQADGKDHETSGQGPNEGE